MKNPKQNAALLIISMLIVGSIVYLERHKKAPLDVNATDVVGETPIPSKPLGQSAQDDRTKSLATKAKTYQKAKEIVDPQGFINTPSFKLSDIVGKKVILIDFWTYSCINCQRTLPYLKMWNEKYKDKGLVIVGMHTPEFDFEKDYNNVLAATKKLGVTYPVVLDSNRSTWTAYNNSYWPREYLIDIDGYVVHDHIGEGDYDKTEQAIQDALKERNSVLGLSDTIDTSISNPSDVITMSGAQIGSPETYFGAERNEYLGNGDKYKIGVQTLTLPSVFKQSTLYIDGLWNFSGEYAESSGSVTKIVYKYNAKNVYFVASSKDTVKAKVLLDGKPIDKGMAGGDVDADSYVSIKENRLYNIVHGSNYGLHTLEIDIDNPGLIAYTFTFG